MNAKTCRQCGELKPMAQFRKYYGGRTGHYTTCKQCEKINSRLKYLDSKSSLTEPERIERDKIYKLYEVQQAAGLKPPRRGGRSIQLGTDLDAMIDKYEAIYKAPAVNVDDYANVPLELSGWLTCELTDEPDIYINDVYEALCKKYRPVLSINQETMMPVHDDTYKGLLDAILKRFYDYEDKYYEED